MKFHILERGSKELMLANDLSNPFTENYKIKNTYLSQDVIRIF